MRGKSIRHTYSGETQAFFNSAVIAYEYGRDSARALGVRICEEH